jgi:hypothetical protein
MMLPMEKNKIVVNLDDCPTQWKCETRSGMMLQMQIRRLGNDYGDATYHDLD